MRLLLCAALGWLAFVVPGRAEVTEFKVLPSATDPKIHAFDSPHVVYVNRNIVIDHQAGLPADRHTLFLWLPGTHCAPGHTNGLCRIAADQGYHVISLMYPDDIPASECREDADPKAFETFRLACIQGGATPHVSVERPDSIENRLIQALRHLQAKRPHEDWAQFLTREGAIKWEALAVGGHSQGAGHAALLGIKHRVARVVCTGGPERLQPAARPARRVVWREIRHAQGSLFHVQP